MKIILRYALCFVLIFALPACGQAQENISSDHFLDIQEIQTESGIDVWLVEDDTLPIIAMSFAFKGAGAAQDALDKQGLTIMASSTLDEGAGDYDGQAFQKTLSDHNITLSFGADRDHFMGRLKTLTKNSDLAFQLLKLALSEPRFDQEALDRMRASHMSRIRSSLSDPKWKAARLVNDVVFEGHPYSQNSGGTLSTLPEITANDLRDLVIPRFAKDNLVISVTGDISAEDLKTKIDDIFATLPDTAQLKSLPDFEIKNQGTTTLYEHDIPQTMIRMMQPGIGRDEPHYYTAKVMNFILGSSGFGSRLTEEIREKRGLTYGIYSGLDEYNHTKILQVSSSTKNESAAELISLVKQEWQKIINEPVAAQELADAQSYLTGALPLSLSSSDKIARLMLSLQLEDLPAHYLDDYKTKVNAVTVEAIQDLSQDLLKPDNFAIILVGQPVDINADKIVTELPNVE